MGVGKMGAGKMGQIIGETVVKMGVGEMGVIGVEVLDLVYILMLLYMYILQGRGRQPLGDKCWCQQKALITLPICCKF